MSEQINILYLEDDPEDVTQLRWILEENTMEFDLHVVDNENDYIRALTAFSPDIIISDHSIIGFDSEQALYTSHQVNHKIPFITLSGTISEEFAVEMMKKGAFDYVLKSKMKRLPFAIQKALEFSRFEEERQNFLKNVIASEALLKEAEKMAHLGSWETDLLANSSKWSDEAFRIYGLEPGEISPAYDLFLNYVHPDDAQYVREMTSEEMLLNNDEIKFNFRIIDQVGKLKYLRSEVTISRDITGKPAKLVGFNLDITAQKVNELKLLESERRYKDLFENSPMPLWIADKETHHFLDVNASALNHYGYSRDEFLSLTALDIRPAEDKENFLKDNPPGRNLTNVGIRRHRKKDGTIIDVEIFASNILYHNKASRLILSIDVTEKLKVQNELKESEDKLKKSQEHLLASQRIGNIGSWELQLDDPDHLKKNALYWSDQVYRIFGFDPEHERINRDKFLEYLLPEDLIKVQETMHKAVVERKNYSIEYKIHQKNGDVRLLKAIAEVIVDPSTGKPGKIIGTSQDITGLRLSEEALVTSEANLSTIVNNTEVSYVLLDTNLIIRYFNSPANEGFIRELNKEIQIGTLMPEYFTGERKKKLIHSCKTVLEGEKVSYETFFDDQNGKILWYDNLNTPVIDKDGKVLGLIMARTDITERKRSELEREKITEDLIQRNNDLEQFAYITSHNLRGPVANILGAVNILQEDNLAKEESETFFYGLKASVDKLDKVIIDLNNILNVKTAINQKKETVSLTKLVNDISYGIQDMIIKEQVSFILDFDACDELHTLKSYLHSIFYNLITNSIKYRKHNVSPVIEISSILNKESFRIIYKDNGLGINTIKLGGQVFGLYKRFHFHTEGKGMGLFMVKTQVETLGGKIQLKSAENEGCEFIIDFKI